MRLRKFYHLCGSSPYANERAVVLTIANVIGAILIITILEHYFRESTYQYKPEILVLTSLK